MLPCPLPSHQPDDLQRQLDATSSAYSRAGLVVNSKKTNVLHLPSDSSPPITFLSVGINMASLNSSRTWEVSSVAILEWQKWGGHCGAKEKSRGANINVKYCWPKVICSMGQSSELEREIKQKTGGASGVASQKSGGPCPPQAPP